MRKELDLPQGPYRAALRRAASRRRRTSRCSWRAFEERCTRGIRSKYHLVIVGDGPLRRILPATRQRTGALTWRSYVQDNAKLADYYHAADLFIHPGVCETFGLVVLEAQACGLPCVGVRGSFMDANIMVGLDLWATRNDPHDIAAAIARFDDQDLAAMGALASKKVRDRFSWDNVFARQWALYTAARLHGVEALHSIEPHPFSAEWVR